MNFSRTILFFFTFCSGIISVSAALTDYELYPSAATEIKEIATLKINFPEAKFLGMWGSRLQGVTLTKKDEPTKVYVPCNSDYSTFFASSSLTFCFKPEGTADDCATVIDEPGEYLLHFPKNTFDLCGSWYSHLGYSEEINITYTIGGDDSGYTAFFSDIEMQISPAPAALTEFSSIKVVFKAGNVIDHVGMDLIRLRRTGDTPAEFRPTACTVTDASDVEMHFRPVDAKYNLPVTICEPGKYVLDIPAGTFRLADTDKVNRPLELTYDVTCCNDKSQEFMKYTLSPAPGNVPQIDEVVLAFPDINENFSFPEGITNITEYVKGRITLEKLENSDELKTYVPFSAILDNDRRIHIKFKYRNATTQKPEVILAKGDYRLTILPNTFKKQSDLFSFNPRIVAYYTVTHVAPAALFDEYQLIPADGTKTGSLENFRIEFPEVTDGIEWPISRDAITLRNTADPDDIYQARMLMLEGNALSWSFNRPEYPYDDRLKITSPGTYQLEIPAGTFVSTTNAAVTNKKITATYIVSPDYEFNYSLSPAEGSVLSCLTSITLTATGDVKSFAIADNTIIPRLVMNDGFEINLEAIQTGPLTVEMKVPAVLAEGDYTLRIPAGFFTKTNSRDITILSPAITGKYKIASARTFTGTVRPASGTSLSGISVISVTPVGSGLKSFSVDDTVGTPTLTGNGRSYTLTGRTSQYSVSFFLSEGTDLPEGEYTFTCPEGYIRTIDNNGLEAPMGQLEATYTIVDYAVPDFGQGIFFLNEGAFGLDYGSINYLEPGYAAMHYDVFSMANKGVGLGVTAQYGEIFGKTLYVISKQKSYSDSEALLTVADAPTMRLRAHVPIPGGNGRALCSVDADKVYIGTASGIYIYNTSDNNIGSVIAGTESDADPYSGQIGDMVRLGHRVYAARQGAGVLVIDTDNDRLIKTISVESIATVFVTATGRLYAATTSQEVPFVEINTTTLEATAVTAAGAPALGNNWNSWRKAPLVPAISGDMVYYEPSGDASRVASLDLVTGEYKEKFIQLPDIGDNPSQLYGSAISVDPETGYVVLTAVSSSSFRENSIFFADASTGHIIPGFTFNLERNYWFPAMAIYPSLSEPFLSDIPAMTMKSGETRRFDPAAETYLSIGNPHLIVYTLTSDNPSVCKVEYNGDGTFTLSSGAEGTATLSCSADYRGCMSRTAFTVTVAGDASLAGVAEDRAESYDVYSVDGRVILTHGTREQLSTLRPGIYIVNSRKLIIRNN